MLGMKTIVLLSQKGGTGKTTLAVNLAVASYSKGNASVIVDLDPQASVSSWADKRDGEYPIVISAQASRLQSILEKAKDNGADYVFIDTAPHSENTSLIAAREADLILIPCQPSILDIRAIAMTANIVQLANKQACVVLNRTSSRGRLAEDAEEAISTYNLPIAPVRLTNRISYVHSAIQHKGVIEYEPKGKAAEEVNILYKFITKNLQGAG